MAWIESHQEIGRHPKTRYAARLAGINVAQTVGHLHLLWHWALDFAQDGDISGFDDWQIEDAALWDGEEGKLYESLSVAGFIDIDNANNNASIHDWYEYAGKLIERRKADAARKREQSAKNPPEPPKTSAPYPTTSNGTPPDVQRNSDGGRKDSNVTVTVPYSNPTVPKESLDGTASADAATDDSKNKRGTRFPDDATLTQEFIDAANDLDFPADRIAWEFDEFKDYWIGVPGPKGVKLNWIATWKNHLRRHIEQRGGLTPMQKSQPAAKPYDPTEIETFHKHRRLKDRLFNRDEIDEYVLNPGGEERYQADLAKYTALVEGQKRGAA